MSLTGKDFELLQIASEMTRRGDTFRPWYGYADRSKRLTKAGYMKEAGITAMWPYLSYVLTDTGRAALTEGERPGSEG